MNQSKPPLEKEHLFQADPDEDPEEAQDSELAWQRSRHAVKKRMAMQSSAASLLRRLYQYGMSAECVDPTVSRVSGQISALEAQIIAFGGKPLFRDK